MDSVRESDVFSLGMIFASSLLFLAYIFLGTPVLAIPPVLLVLGSCVARYAPKASGYGSHFSR
ncbi:hypothetical protein SAMN05421858_0371 [Haladaptatus litoreus]|uniref:Uncharacterized protein n=1 Tax=Haladaptatus litoreus TaxID=553468 RepID=A0A1N6VIB6_9EURY|nr:hypothetical protein SAMN05421858_0371 [Haladaptatus litoreus]